MKYEIHHVDKLIAQFLFKPDRDLCIKVLKQVYPDAKFTVKEVKKMTQHKIYPCGISEVLRIEKDLYSIRLDNMLFKFSLHGLTELKQNIIARLDKQLFSLEERLEGVIKNENNIRGR